MPRQYGTRKPNRAPDFDYRSPCSYFVTICVQGRCCLFGLVTDATMRNNAVGTMVANAWSSLPQVVPEVQLEAFAVMPNHVHGIIQLVHGTSAERLHLGSVLQTVKRLTTHQYVQGVLAEGWPRFDGRLWQRSYHDHILRDDRDMDRLREDIASNPARWSEDRIHA